MFVDSGPSSTVPGKIISINMVSHISGSKNIERAIRTQICSLQFVDISFWMCNTCNPGALV